MIIRDGKANWERHVRLRQSPSDADSVAVTKDHQTLFHDSALGPSINSEDALLLASRQFHSSSSRTSTVSFTTTDTFGGGRGTKLPTMPPKASLGLPFNCSICGKLVDSVSSRSDWE